MQIKSESIPIVRKALQTKKGRGLRPLVYFLEEAFLWDDGSLVFKSTGRYDSPYDPDEDEGTVPVLIGKWYEAEQVAEWLKPHALGRTPHPTQLRS